MNNNYDGAAHRAKLQALDADRTKYNVAKFVKVPSEATLPGSAVPLSGATPNQNPPTGGPTTITKVRCPECGLKRIIEQEPKCSCEKANQELRKENQTKSLERN